MRTTMTSFDRMYITSQERDTTPGSADHNRWDAYKWPMRVYDIAVMREFKSKDIYSVYVIEEQ